MKKLTKILAIVLAVMMVLSFVACDPAEDPAKDPCTTHTDANKDGKCDTCGAAVSTEDDNNDPCTEHTDANEDGKCDTCGATVEVTPPECTEHVDANTDGKCDTCGATVEVTPPACEHVDEDEDGKCDECGADVPPPPIEYYVPPVSAFEAGVDYDWDGRNGISMDFETQGSKFVVVSTDGLDLGDADGFDAFAAKAAGQDTFAFSGFSSAINAEYFTAGWVYSISFGYYAKATGGNVNIVAITADGTRVIKENAITDGAGNVNFDYKVVDGDTGIAIVTAGAAEIYIGTMDIALAKDGLTMNALWSENGYDFDISKLEFQDSEVITIGEIEEAEVKEALLAAGYSESDPVCVVIGGELQNFKKAEFFTPGLRYTLTFKTYSTGSGGHLIAMDSTSGNHGVTGGFIDQGYAEKSITYDVGDKGDYIFTFYATPKTYLVGMNFKLVVIDNTEKLVYQAPDSFVEVTAEDLVNGKVFDFAADNCPNLASPRWIKIDELTDVGEWGEMKQFMTADNGFGDYTFELGGFWTPCFNDLISAGDYSFTVRVFSADGTVPTNGPWAILEMSGATAEWNGTQVGSANVGKSVTEVEGMTNVYDITYSGTITADGDNATTNSLFWYVVGSVPAHLYVTNISLQFTPAA